MTDKSKINILIACEESQTICLEFRKLGFNCYSCDLQKCSGGHPEYHFLGDAFDVISNKGGVLENSTEEFINGEWDLVIAHPPCTYLALSGNKWFYHPDDKMLPVEKRRPHPLYPDRRQRQKDGMDFFMKFVNLDIKYIAIENPTGVMNTRYRKPDQTVQPWMFGDSAVKTTCLWLKNLPNLIPTDIVDKGNIHVTKGGNKIPEWYSNASQKNGQRQKVRSKTFPGFAKAVAIQWGEFILQNE